MEVAEGFITFEISEDDERWQSLEHCLGNWNAVDVPSTKFTTGELKRAEWLRMIPNWHHGYPQPNEEDCGYLKVTFDSEKQCSSCGIRGPQKAPFRMKAEPKWGQRSILQLNWVFDEFFVTPTAHQNVFACFDVLSRTVENTRGDQELSTAVQLDIRGETCLALGDYSGVCCKTCSRQKFEPIAKGEFPQLESPPLHHISRTAEYFGSGASAHRAVIVSQALYRAIIGRELKGTRFVPVKSDRD